MKSLKEIKDNVIRFTETMRRLEELDTNKMSAEQGRYYKRGIGILRELSEMSSRLDVFCDIANSPIQTEEKPTK